MNDEPVIGADDAQEDGIESHAEPVIGGTADDAPRSDASEAELAELLRETLLAAHDDLSPADLEGESPAEVRERYVAVRARLEREAAEAKGAPVPAQRHPHDIESYIEGKSEFVEGILAVDGGGARS